MTDALTYCMEYDYDLECKIRRGFGNVLVLASLRQDPKLIRDNRIIHAQREKDCSNG